MLLQCQYRAQRVGRTQEKGKRRVDIPVVDIGVVASAGQNSVVDALDSGQRNLAVLDGVHVGRETRNDLHERAVEAGVGRDGAVGTDGQSGEGLEGQSAVRRGARLDKGRSDREDLVKVQGGVLGARPARVLEDGRVDPGLVAGLGSEDRAGDGDVGLLGDAGSGAEVGRDTDVLDEGREAKEGLDVGHGELVRAGLDGSGAEGAREEGDVLGFVLGDLRDTVADLFNISVCRLHRGNARVWCRRQRLMLAGKEHMAVTVAKKIRTQSG